MIVVADLHFGKESDSFMRDGVPSQRLDLLHRLEKVSERAGNTGQSLVLAGDVFNRVNPPSSVIAAFFGWLSNVPTRVYIIAGNHDSGVDWVNVGMVQNANLPNVTVVSGHATTVTVADSTGTHDVTFWPHMPVSLRERIEAVDELTLSEFAAKEVGRNAIVVTHGQVVAMDYSNDIFFEAGDAMPIDPRAFKSGTLIVSGHIHKHSSCTDERESGDVVVVYPGSVTINNFGEVDEMKGFIEVDLSDRSWTFTEWDDDVTPWHHVEIDLTDKDESGIDEDVVAELATGAVLKITVIAKDYGVVNESAIRSLFGKYGYVARFETKYISRRDPTDSAIQTGVSHAQLLREWLSGEDAAAKVKAKARSIGDEIILEVLS